MNDSSQQPQTYNGDEIDLRDLILILLDGWYWIVGCTLAAIIGAFVYVSLQTPIYETQFKAVPAPASNFSGFNLLDDEFEITPNHAYRAFGNQLSGYQNFQAFFEKHRGDFAVEGEVDSSRLFAERLEVSGLTASNDDELILTIDYRYPEGEAGSEILNAYVEETAKTVWQTLRSQFHEYNRAQIARLETDLELEKENLRQAREDRLFVLEQAIAVARRLDIDKPTTPQQFGRQPTGTEVFYASISGDGSLPLYFMGYQTLEADRDTLKDALDQGLSSSVIRETEQNLKRHKRIAELLNNEALSGVDQDVTQNTTKRVVQVVEYAFEPANRSEPKKGLTLILSTIVGGMLGVMLAFLAKLAANMKSYRKQKQSSTRPE